MPERSAVVSSRGNERDVVGQDELVDAFLAASRALVGVAARSLADLAEDVTLAQFRVLIELAARGPLRLADLAVVLGVDRSTSTRMCDRLVRKHLVQRRRVTTDRRSVRISLSTSGRLLVKEASARRREEIARILRRLPVADRASALNSLRAFAEAAGEVPEQDWALGWNVHG